MTSTAGPGRPRRWAAGLAWALWLASLLCLAAVPWLDELLRRAGRADLVQFVFPDVAIPVLALVSSATVGAVVAARRPAHPVGWLLLGIALSLTGTAATAQYFVYGLLVRPGALPAARYAVLYQPATTFTALTLIGFVLLFPVQIDRSSNELIFFGDTIDADEAPRPETPMRLPEVTRE